MAAEAVGGPVSIKAKWSGRRLVVTAPALYEEGEVELSASCLGCHCKEMLRAIEGKWAGLAVDFKEGIWDTHIVGARIEVGLIRARWCPFCGKSLRLSCPKYETRSTLP